jgi:hypothetical protein
MLLTILAFLASAAAIQAPDHRRPLANWRRAITPTAFKEADHEPFSLAKKWRAAKKEPRALLQIAYSACGLATTAAWTAVVLTTIRSNQPLGMMMPTLEHGLFARIGALSAAPLILSCFSTLASASKESWEQLGSPTCRRLNLALVTAGLGSALWVGFAPILTRIPGTLPLVSHQAYSGAMRAALIGAFGSGSALSAAVWARSLPEDVRKNPLSWPGRVADGVANSLVSLAPANANDPINVKYSLLAASFLVFTAVPLLSSFPLTVIPSWTGRRLSLAFPAWTLLATVSSINLKEAAESGKLLADSTYCTLSDGLRGFGAVYLSAKFGAVVLDPSFPEAYHAVKMVPGPAAAAILMIGLTLRPDKMGAVDLPDWLSLSRLPARPVAWPQPREKST